MQEHDYELMKWLTSKVSPAVAFTALHLQRYVGLTFCANDLIGEVGLYNKASINEHLRRLRKAGIIYLETFRGSPDRGHSVLYWVATTPGEKCPESIRHQALKDRYVATIVHPQHGEKKLYNGRISSWCKEQGLDQRHLRRVIDGEWDHHHGWRLKSP